MTAPRERNLSMWAYHLRLLDDLPERDRPEDHIEDAATLTAWQWGWRTRLHAALGARPDGVDLDLSVEPDPRPGDEGFTRHRLLFAGERHLDVPATLLLPDEPRDVVAGRGPAVVAVHGHGPDPWVFDHGRATVVGPTPQDPDAAAAITAQCPPFGAGLARAGYAVLAPDLRGFGERWDRWP